MTEGKKLILITRPLAESLDYAAELEALGFQTLIEPVLELQALPFDSPDFSHYQAVIFTSRNGVDYLMKGLKPPPRGMKALCVGDRTAAAVQDAGFDALSASGNGAALVDMVARDFQPGSGPLLHVRGYHTAIPVHILLQERGFSVDLCTVYRAQERGALGAETIAAIRANRVAAIPFFSKRTARHFIDLAIQSGLESHFHGIKALSISASVLECVQPHSWAGTYASQTPDKQGMTQLLLDVCGI